MAKRDYPSDKQDQYMVRFPEGMRDVLKYAAAENKRSLNAEIIHRLERSIRLEEAIAEGEARFSQDSPEEFPTEEWYAEQREISELEREFAAESQKILHRLIKKHGMEIFDPEAPNKQEPE